MTQPVFRFAPSPNGRLHLGHAYSALLNEKQARRAGGRLLLRIEDIDGLRCKPEFVQGVIDDLAWLGIRFEAPVRVQSQHMGDYRAALQRLDAMGLLYRCTCTRTSKLPPAALITDPDGTPLYAGNCREHGPKDGVPFALRLKVDDAMARLDAPLTRNERGSDILVTPSDWGDVILARKDIGTSYHLSVVVDDALQGVTHVVRGQDMQAATSIHRLLQALLGLPPPVYHHHDLIRHQTGRKLSKSDGDRSLAELRADGKTPGDIRALLGF